MTAQTRTSPGSACGGDEHGLVHSPAADTPATADAPSEVSYERVDPDRYVVLHDGPVGSRLPPRRGDRRRNSRVIACA